jgi:hypothetical protein
MPPFLRCVKPRQKWRGFLRLVRGSDQRRDGCKAHAKRRALAGSSLNVLTVVNGGTGDVGQMF